MKKILFAAALAGAAILTACGDKGGGVRMGSLSEFDSLWYVLGANIGNGINFEMRDIPFDFKAIDKRRKGVINNLSFGLETLLWKKARGIDVIKGKAYLKDAHTIEVDTGKEKKLVTAENIVLAVGSEPAEIPAFNVDHMKVSHLF